MKEAHDGALVMGVIVTVPGDGNSSYDAFSRFFAPLYGVNEDPVTGETHFLIISLKQTFFIESVPVLGFSFQFPRPSEEKY